MNKTIKKVSLILTIAVVFTLLTVIGVMGVDSYTTISTPEDFMNIENNLGGKYKLANDIDFSEIDFDGIGSENEPFTGVFDGVGYTVKNVTISGNPGNDAYIAVFNNNEGAVTNVKFENVTVNAESDSSVYAAVVAAVNSGRITNVTVTNCEVNATAKYGVARAGGVSAYTTGVGNVDACVVETTSATATSEEMYAFTGAFNTSDLGDVTNCTGSLENDFVYGDCDNNGTIDIFDLISLAKAVVSGEPIDTPAADANGDTTVDIFDLIKLAKYIIDNTVVLGPTA